MDKEIRNPKQSRSIEKKRLIQEAAYKLFSEKGFEKTSTNEIASVAGVSIGTLYSYYKDKKSIFSDIMDKFVCSTIESMSIVDRKMTGNPMQNVESYIRTLIASHNGVKDFQLELTCMSLRYSDCRDAQEQVRKRVRDSIVMMLNLYKEHLHIQNPVLASFLIQDSVENFVHEIVYYDSLEKSGIDTDCAIRELVIMLCRYVFKPEYLEQFEY